MVVDDTAPNASPPSPSPQYAPFDDKHDRPNPIHASKKIRVALEPPPASSNVQNGGRANVSVKTEPTKTESLTTPKTEHSSAVKSEIKTEPDSKDHVKSESDERVDTSSTSGSYTTTFVREQATFLRPSIVPSRTRCESKRASVNSGYVPQMADGFKRNMHAEKSNIKVKSYGVSRGASRSLNRGAGRGRGQRISVSSSPPSVGVARRPRTTSQPYYAPGSAPVRMVPFSSRPVNVLDLVPEESEPSSSVSLFLIKFFHPA